MKKINKEREQKRKSSGSNVSGLWDPRPKKERF